jgi:hypothetical protein
MYKVDGWSSLVGSLFMVCLFLCYVYLFVSFLLYVYASVYQRRMRKQTLHKNAQLIQTTDIKGEPATIMGQYSNNGQQIWQSYGQIHQQPYNPTYGSNGQSFFSYPNYTNGGTSAQHHTNTIYTDSAQSPFNPSERYYGLYNSFKANSLSTHLQKQQCPDTPTKTPNSPTKQEYSILTVSPTIVNSEPTDSTSPLVSSCLPGFSNITSVNMLQEAITANPEEVFNAVSLLSETLETTKSALATTQENLHHSRSDYASMRAMFEQLVEIGEQKLILAYKMMERLREGDLRIIGDQELMRRVQESNFGLEKPMMKTSSKTDIGLKGTGPECGGGFQVKGPNGWFVPGVNGRNHMTLLQENSASKDSTDCKSRTNTMDNKMDLVSHDTSDFNRGRSQGRERGGISKSPKENAWKEEKEGRFEDSTDHLKDMESKGREKQGFLDLSHGQPVEAKRIGIEKSYSDIGLSQAIEKEKISSSAICAQSNDTKANKGKVREMFNPNAVSCRLPCILLLKNGKHSLSGN